MGPNDVRFPHARRPLRGARRAWPVPRSHHVLAKLPGRDWPVGGAHDADAVHATRSDLACHSLAILKRMADGPKWFQPDYRFPERKPAPGELLFEFVPPSDPPPMSCQLRFHGDHFAC